MTNKYFEGVAARRFDYFKKYPKRRRAAITMDKSYDIYDKHQHFGVIYDAGKLNAFIKVINDKLYMATSRAEGEELKSYISEMEAYESFKEKTVVQLNNALFKKIFYKGDFFNIEIFKEIITQCIANSPIKRIVFGAMPYKFPVEKYLEDVLDAKVFHEGKEYTVAVSYSEGDVQVAMWDHTMPY